MQHIEWYPFFNNQNQDIDMVLTRKETIYPQNVLIAQKKNNCWIYAKFVTMDQFIEHYKDCDIKERTFYAILTDKTRYLYLDIDYKLSSYLSLTEHELLISTIQKYLNKFVAIYGNKFGIKYKNSKWIIWDASRLSNNKKYFVDKFSLHIIDVGNILHYLDIKLFAEKFSYWLTKNNAIFDDCVIDNNIYHAGYQAWRLPYNHNGDERALLKLYNQTMNLKDQFEINIMHKLKNIESSYLNELNLIENKIANKQYTLAKNVTIQHPINQFCKSSLTIFQFNGIPMNCIYPNLINVGQIIHKKLYIMLGVNMHKKIKNYEYILTNHYCPILKGVHKRNSGRLLLLHIPNHSNSEHCAYICMDAVCRKRMRQKFICLSTKFKRPWLMYKLHNLDEKLLIELDTFIDLLINNNILIYNKESEQSIIKTNKLRFDQKNLIFSTYINDKVIHNACGLNNISLSYKHSAHRFINYGGLTLYCKNCKIFVNFKNNNLIHKSEGFNN